MRVLLSLFIVLALVQLTQGKRPTKPKANSRKILEQSSTSEPRTKILGGTLADSKYVKGSAHIYYAYEDYYDGEYYGTYYYSICSGSIVGSKWILTAAHCVTDYYGYYDYYNYGAVPGTKFATLKEIYDYGGVAKKVYIHKKYEGGDLEYDIALLELESNIPSSRYTKVTLSAPPDEDNVIVKAVGYGVTDANGAGTLSEPLRLMMTDMRYRNYDWCEEEDPLSSPGKGKMLCATSTDWPNGKTGVCFGDSGGPLLHITEDGNLNQFGVLSYGTSGICGDYASLDWYVEISHVTKAIKKKNAKFFDIYEQYYYDSGSQSSNTEPFRPSLNGRKPNHWSKK